MLVRAGSGVGTDGGSGNGSGPGSMPGMEANRMGRMADSPGMGTHLWERRACGAVACGSSQSSETSSPPSQEREALRRKPCRASRADQGGICRTVRPVSRRNAA